MINQPENTPKIDWLIIMLSKIPFFRALVELIANDESGDRFQSPFPVKENHP